MSEALLRLEGVAKEFRAAGQTLHVLKGVSLSVAPAETVAVTGPSGSGKSTLLAVMAGLERPSHGRVLHRGRPLPSDEDRLAEWRRTNLGFIFQNFRLVPGLTALENAALPLEIAGLGAGEAAERAAELLKSLGLSKRAGHYPHELSGGEQQRVAIARAYAHEPPLILADEPTGSLDRETALRVLDALLEANSRHKAALVVVTHDPGVAGRMSRRVALESGSLA